jgi:hypothetical protein
MCHPVLFGLLIGALAAKLFFRLRRGGGGGGHGGWCGGWRGGRGGGRGRFWRRGFGTAEQPPARQPVQLGDLSGALDLNERQRQEAAEVFTALRNAGVANVEALLDTAAADRFDGARAEAELATAPADLKKEVLDGLEHLHNILTAEQRDRLRGVVRGGSARYYA